ncbi:MAG: DUF3796 domain-containing protein [Clostridiales bacterium]|nr:DUF3796 domain-containing protein [Clostridiales bacterium]
MKRVTRIPPMLGVLGILGILGFFFRPFFCIFFSFFGFFFWGLLGKERSDERLVENLRKTGSIAGRLGMLLCFFLLFALERQISADAVLLYGSIAYACILILAPALAYLIDKRG